jgi:processive 1,2-diacylglycerol beta-glucosyltransferase
VLILSAGVGRGHDAAAENLREELLGARPGLRVNLGNGLGSARGAGRLFLERFSRWQLIHCPRMYSLLYLLGIRWAPGRWLGSRLLYLSSRRRLRTILGEHRPEVLVCTYPGVTSALAMMRARGELDVPLCSVITDLASLHFWSHPGVDLHLLSYGESQAEVSRIAPGSRALVVRPPLGSSHWLPREHATACVNLSLDPATPLVVISGGGWGIGDISGAVSAALELEEVQVIAVCGDNGDASSALRARFAGEPRVRVLDFSRQMPDLLTAASVLVHCTGGMTCLEAAVHGCPVIAYGLCVGHIAYNTSAMVDLGLVEQAEDLGQLGRVLRETIARPRRQASPIRARPSAAAAVLALLPYEEVELSTAAPELGLGRFAVPAQTMLVLEAATGAEQ